MITKIRSFQDSFWVKGILILTALSFMSLFGISGYLGRANANRPIIKVDDTVIYRDEINAQLNQQIQTAKALLGDSAEISDEMKNAMMLEIVQKNVINAIIQKAADDNDISISDELVRKIIYLQPEFADADGRFSLEKMRRMLSISGWSEQQYIDTLRRDIIKQHIVASPVEGMTLPAFMNDYIAKLDGQRKVFQYVTVKPAAMKIDRSISADELEQYYQDFAGQFEEPESRDISFITFSADQLASSYMPSEDEIKAYYDENINEYVTPESRNVLQMVFDNREDADKARTALDKGTDFYSVAKDIAKQDKASTELGNVSKDMLIADMSDAVFELPIGGIAGPVKSDLGWHIMKVVSVAPKKETTLASVRSKIVDAIRKDKAYEQAGDTIAEIEDKLGAGASLEQIAQEYKAQIHKVSGLTEDGSAKTAAAADKALIATPDFIDTAFSYNSGETSQVLETDEGFALVKIGEVHEARLKDVDSVRGDIVKLWEANEKSAIAQELVNDITHDLENGDKLADVAARFNIGFKTSAPLKKNQQLAALSPVQMNELFQESLNMPKTFNNGDEFIIAVPSKIIQAERKPTAKETEALRNNYLADINQTIADELIQSYGAEYDVRIKYRNLGLEENI
ncbi:MAG: peptidyl-prolyl cis-trans isomerase [Proteobacteria bacterium]|nr:peptidyl-prolyl cis-trans isomerase [Pseudomonadota bacterium]